jgi:hypothetical protein
MLELKSLNPNNVELTSEEQKNINGALGGIAGGMAGNYIGDVVASGQGSTPRIQGVAKTFWTGVGSLFGNYYGGASLAE